MTKRKDAPLDDKNRKNSVKLRDKNSVYSVVKRNKSAVKKLTSLTLKLTKTMARNVTYSVSPRINPRDKDASPKFYGHVQASGDINIREMSERIQATCTVHKSDVFAVLVALEDVITEALQNGEIVRLGDLGSLQIGISSKGALTEEDYTDSLITKARINFRPGSALVGILSNLSFAKVKVRTSKAEKEAEEGEPEGGV